MRDLNTELKNKVFDFDKAVKYGFVKNDSCYIYKEKICNSQFEIIVSISKEKNIARLIDLANDEDYVLVDIETYAGEFVGKVKNEYDNVLKEILEKCTIANVFKSKQAKEIIKYVKEKYSDDLEFLWEKFDNNAIVRNKINNKWYLLFCIVPKSKIGINSDELIEIIDLRYEKGMTEEIIDNIKVFPGYHMNKNSWITIKLDSSMTIKEIKDLIDNSYSLSLKKK